MQITDLPQVLQKLDPNEKYFNVRDSRNFSLLIQYLYEESAEESLSSSCCHILRSVLHL